MDCQENCENKCVINDTLPQPENSVLGSTLPATKSSTITENKDSDVDGSMECFESVVTDNSNDLPIRGMEENENTMEKGKELNGIAIGSLIQCIEANDPELQTSSQQCLLTSEETVEITVQLDKITAEKAVQSNILIGKDTMHRGVKIIEKIMPNNGNTMEEIMHCEKKTMENIVHSDDKTMEVTMPCEKKSMENTMDANGKTIENIIHTNDKNMKNNEVSGDAVTSLSVIALEYDNSDSESEQVECINVEKNSKNVSNEMEIQITKEYRTVQGSSDEDSESDNSSSSSSSSSNSESDVESNQSDTENNSRKSNATKKKNEKNSRFTGTPEKESKSEFDDLPPIEDLKISVPEVLCDPLGEVAWMVEQMVVVRPKPGKPTLNLDTILFVERGRRVLGRIFDVFGKVSDPHYCVRFNSSEHIKESDIKVGMTAYFCPNTEYTSVVFVQDLLKMKATDELGDDEHPEFSDDEEERAYYTALKQKQKSDKGKTADEVPQKRQRTDPSWKSNHPWSSGRKQDQSKKPEKTYNTPGWPGGTQQNVRNQGNLWQQQQQQYPPAYPNISWSSTNESYQGNSWSQTCPPQNSYNHSEPFDNRHPPRNSRPFFRPPRSFQSGPVPYMQNGHYSEQTNSRRFPGMNFPWHSSGPRQPDMSWRFTTPPPPPPPPGM